MPIINMISNNASDFPLGAVCPLSYNTKSERDRGCFVVTYETHHGLCLEDREINGYDDSDFYMIVWNRELNKSEKIVFASTRGWSYPCYGSSVDATPEVRAAYAAYIAAQHRRMRIQARWDARNKERAVAAKIGVSRCDIQRLRAAVGSNWTGIEKLLTANLRSGFKKSMKEQVLSWLADAAPKFNSPLSAKQMQYL